MSCRGAALISISLLAGLLAACADPATDFAGGPDAAGIVVALPPARDVGPLSLEEALAQRRSQRSYGDESLSREAVSQLLWAAQGVTGAGGGRTAPSAGGLYPLELYLADVTGVHHYLPSGHLLERTAAADIREPLAEAGLDQAALREAPAVFVIAAEYARTAGKYGDRAGRYVEMEAGHAAQNLLLQAVALGLAAVPIGAFHDDSVAIVLDLPAGLSPLYLIPVGHPVRR